MYSKKQCEMQERQAIFDYLTHGFVAQGHECSASG